MGKNTKKILTMPETFNETLHETLVSEQAQLTSAVQAVNEKIEKNAGVQRNKVANQAPLKDLVMMEAPVQVIEATSQKMLEKMASMAIVIEDQDKEIITLKNLVEELQNRKCFQPIGEAVKNWAINLVGKIFRKKANQTPSPKTVVEIDGINEIPAEGLVITNN